MKILVITLATIEQERDACLAAIRQQKGITFEHLVFANFPKQQAHEKLYGTFMQRRNEFDLLVKVDADMVLCRDDFFASVAETFERENNLDILSVGVDDFFTGRIINGLNIYRNTLRWSPSGDAVMTDRFPRDPSKARSDYHTLAPAARHCPDPSDFQAFHYGLHRGVKAAVATKRRRHELQFMRIRDIEWVWQQFHQRRDRRLALAVLGAELALVGEIGEDHLNYNDPHVHRLLNQYTSSSIDDLEQEIRRLRRATFGYLPGRVRTEVLRGGWAAPLRCLVPIEARKAALLLIRRFRSSTTTAASDNRAG